VLQGYPATDRFFSEFLLATLLQLFEALHPGVRIDVQRVLFAHAAAPLEDRHARAFRGPVLFNQRAHALRFARRLLDLPRGALAPWPDETGRVPRVLSVGGATPVSERVRAWLGTRSTLADIDAGSVARALGLTPRALRRRLASDGTSLTALADEVRCRTARDALARNVPIDVIVEQTGFRERSGFFRAFKRWTGRTPSHFRGADGMRP
jgi:AraC-like DNA-binding protein